MGSSVEALQSGLDLPVHQLGDAQIHNVSAVVAPSLSDKPTLFDGAWYTDSNLKEVGFRWRFEEKYPDTRFATHMMPYAYDSVNLIVNAFETGQNPAVDLRKRRYDGRLTALVVARTRGQRHDWDLAVATNL